MIIVKIIIQEFLQKLILIYNLKSRQNKIIMKKFNNYFDKMIYIFKRK